MFLKRADWTYNSLESGHPLALHGTATCAVQRMPVRTKAAQSWNTAGKRCQKNTLESFRVWFWINVWSLCIQKQRSVGQTFHSPHTELHDLQVKKLGLCEQIYVHNSTHQVQHGRILSTKGPLRELGVVERLRVLWEPENSQQPSPSPTNATTSVLPVLQPRPKPTFCGDRIENVYCLKMKGDNEGILRFLLDLRAPRSNTGQQMFKGTKACCY